MTYQIRNNLRGTAAFIARDDGAFIPLDVGNRDCRQFIEDWKAGATVLDADASPLPYSADAARALGLGG